MITRFAVLPDERRLLLGLDKAELFEPGYVYEVSEIIGEIIIRKIGKYAMQPTAKDNPCMLAYEYSDANQQIYSGLHLITEEEYQKLRP